ncbi:hypothetical protein OPQ81_000779 [Rhizoctonia solani]|nr:hypothetical protein OPQ81_000779 [Rhizoctonia solani]
MSSLSLNLTVYEDLAKATQIPVLLSRSRVTYHGPNRYRSERMDLPPETLPELVCIVCLEKRDLVLPTSLCTHGPVICLPCLEEYVIHAIRVGGLIRLVCPAVGCEQEMRREEVVKYIGEDEECLDRFNALKTQEMLENHPNFRWCTNAACGRGQIHPEGASIVVCDYCATLSCFLHQVPWHEGLTCEQYMVEQENMANNEYLTTRTKRCPKPTCRFPIEKMSGCDRMTCRCGHQFCWACLADYALIRQQGNIAHNSGCRHYYVPNPYARPRRNAPVTVRPRANANARVQANPANRAPIPPRRRRPATLRTRARDVARRLTAKVVRLISSVCRLSSRAT